MEGTTTTRLLIGGAAVFALGVAPSLVSAVIRHVQRLHWRDVASKRRAIRDLEFTSLPAVSLAELGITPELAALLAGGSARDICAAIAEQRLSSVQVVEFFARSGQAAQAAYNCCVTVLYTEALERARQLDAHLRATGTVVGPLHGLPFSVKEHISLKNTDNTAGVAKRCFRVCIGDESPLITALREAGAIPLFKTNIPQTLLMFECNNPIYGRTLSAWSSERTPGGSSGGEACLISVGGSVLGIGTDIGGSVRIPAHYSGCVGLKPTSDVLSRLGINPVVVGQDAVKGTVGPMSRTVDDIVLAMRVWLSSRREQLDGSLPPLLFNEAEYTSTRRLRVGILKCDGFFDASRACLRAVDDAVASLQAAGHECINFGLHGLSEKIMHCHLGILSADGGATLMSHLRNEDVDPCIFQLMRLSTMRRWQKRIVLAMLRWKGWDRLVRTGEHVGIKTVDELWKYHHVQKQLKAEFLAYWNTARFDVLIAPGHGVTAIPHNLGTALTPACSYTIFANVLDLPAGVVPVRLVTQADLAVPRAAERDPWEAAAAAADAGSVGLPVGVQVIGAPYAEATVLRVMREIEQARPFQPAADLKTQHLASFYK